MKKLFFILLVLSVFFILPCKGQVASYSFNENSGTSALDSSSFNNKAFATGSNYWVAGKFGSAFWANGSSYLRVSNSSSININGTNRLTISFWLKLNSTLDGAIVSKPWASTVNWPWYQYSVVYGFNSLLCYIGNSANVYTLTGPSLTVGQWNYITMTHDGAAIKLYINGVLYSSASAPVNITAKNTDLTIGTDFGGPFAYFNGVIDELRIYNSVISLSKMTNDMNNPVTPPAPIETIPPSQPTNFVANPNSLSSISLSWNPSVDNVGIAGYEIERATNSSFKLITSLVSTNYIDSNLPNSTAQSYKVRAKDVNNNYSLYSSIASSTTFYPPPAKNYTLAFDTPNPKTNISVYILYSSLDNGVSYSFHSYCPFDPSASINYVSVTDLVKTFYYVVSKSPSGIESDPSNVLTIDAEPPGLPPTQVAIPVIITK